MVVSKKKPIEELMAMLGDAKKVGIVGCKSCASACAVGGEKECNEMKAYLEEKGVEVVGNMVGEILTVQEAGGFQMNIAKWDEETLRLWNTPCHTPAYSKE